MNDKQRMLWTMVGMIQMATKEAWSDELIELFKDMEGDLS